MSATRRSQRHASPVATALWAVQHKKFLRAFVERPQAGGYSEIMHGRYRQSLLDMANPRLISQVRRELDFHARPLPTLVSEGRASATSTSPLAVIVDSDVEDGVQNSFACVIRWSHRPVAVKEHSKSLRLDGRQGRATTVTASLARLDAVGSVFRRLRRWPWPCGMLIVARASFRVRLSGSLGSPPGLHRSRELSTAFRRKIELFLRLFNGARFLSFDCLMGLRSRASSRPLFCFRRLCCLPCL